MENNDSDKDINKIMCTLLGIILLIVNTLFFIEYLTIITFGEFIIALAMLYYYMLFYLGYWLAIKPLLKKGSKNE